MSYVIGAFERKLRPEMERVSGPVPGLAPPAGVAAQAKTEPAAQKSDVESKVMESEWDAFMAMPMAEKAKYVVPAALVLWWLVGRKRR